MKSPNLFFNNNGFMELSSIGGIIIILLMLLIGVFGFFSITGEGDLSSDYNKTFAITDPLVNQSLYVMGGLNGIIVEQILSDGSIVFVNPLEWNYDALYITVNQTVLI